MQDLDADALYAIFKSLAPTEENLQEAHMWSKSNHAFKNTFDRLVSNHGLQTAATHIPFRTQKGDASSSTSRIVPTVPQGDQNWF